MMGHAQYLDLDSVNQHLHLSTLTTHNKTVLQINDG